MKNKRRGRKIINNHIAEGIRESHRRVPDLITDEGSVPEMRIWSISIFIPIKNGVYIFVEVSI